MLEKTKRAFRSLKSSFDFLQTKNAIVAMMNSITTTTSTRRIMSHADTAGGLEEILAKTEVEVEGEVFDGEGFATRKEDDVESTNAVVNTVVGACLDVGVEIEEISDFRVVE